MLIRKFIKLSSEEKRLLVEAAFFIFFSKLFLLLPFRLCIKRLNSSIETNKDMNFDVLLNVKHAISRANKLAFWKNKCLVKSFAARFMLQRRNIGSVLYLGLHIKDNKKLIAHAWLVSGDIFVTPQGKVKHKTIFSI